MTINQIHVILTAAKAGSISAAAKTLELSQPNVSSAIRNTEEEVGFSIFTRTSEGVRVTEKGTLFLEHARRIAEETDRIMEISRQEPLLQLRVAHTNLATAFRAFELFCRENRDARNTSLGIQTVTIEKGVRLLEKQEVDVLACVALRDDADLLRRYCEDSHLAEIFVAEKNAAITIRRDHPLFAMGLLQDPEEGFSVDLGSKESMPLLEQMSNYPFVYYGKLDAKGSPLHTFRNRDIPYSSIILVDSIEDRARIVSATNAYSTGLQKDDATEQRYGVVSIPVRNFRAGISCLVRKGDIARPQISRYISILKSVN